MDYNLITNIKSCYVEIPSLLYYSHIPTIVISLVFGCFILFKNRTLAGKLLFSITLVFSTWLSLSLIVWTNFNSKIIFFSWSFFGVLYVLLYLLCLYFAYVFLEKRDVSLKTKFIVLIPLFPVIVFSFSKYNLSVFDVANCEAIEEALYLNYYYLLGFAIFLFTIFFLIIKYFKAKDLALKKQIGLLFWGVGLFLLLFFLTTYVASLIDNFELEQYSLFGMTFFLGVLAYLIVKYKAFDIKMLGAQALVVALVVLVGSQFFFIQTNTNRILTGITLVLIGIFGIFLIRSIKAEAQRKEELQYMSDRLAVANDNLRKLDNAKSEFISIASHQLRTPLTAIKGFISLLNEGTFGKLDPRQAEVLEKVFISNERLITLVEDLLNISRIESGRMEFRFAPCQLENLCSELIDTFSFKVRDAKLYLDFKKPEYSLPEVFVDAGKVREVLSNLIDNAIKYTPKGGVTVRLERVFAPDAKIENLNERGAVRIIVADTGIGVPAEEVPYLFSKFSRGKDTSRLNTGGTGLGLYVGKSMIEANGGKVWVESEGTDKGSRFIIEVPVEQTQENLTRWS